LALLVAVSIFVALMFALDESTGVIALILLFIPGLLAYFFVLCWGHVAICLTYQALKPEPTEIL
jgi:hypothetical protein